MTNLTSTQVAQLTALLLGESGFKRAASKDAAIQRFYSVASDNGIAVADAAQALEAETFEAAQETVKAAMAARRKADQTAVAKFSVEQAFGSDPLGIKAARSKAVTASEKAIITSSDLGLGWFANKWHDGTMTLINHTEGHRIDLPVDSVERLRAIFAKVTRKTGERKPREGGPTKREIAANLLTREGGCTTKDILEATGWPAVSVPAIAKASGLTLRQEKDGRTTRYFGTPAA